MSLGTKGLLDALKVKTTGRRDGKLLYYFGAIEEDAPGRVDVVFRQEFTGHPKDSGVRIQVNQMGEQGGNGETGDPA